MRIKIEKVVKEIEKQLGNLANSDSEEELESTVESGVGGNDIPEKQRKRVEGGKGKSSVGVDGDKDREVNLHTRVSLLLNYGKGSVLNRLLGDKKAVEKVLKTMYFAKFSMEDGGTLRAEKANPIFNIDLTFRPGLVAAQGVRVDSNLPFKILVRALDIELCYLITMLAKEYVMKCIMGDRNANQDDKCISLYI